MDAKVVATLSIIVCDQNATAPIWGYILRQQGLAVVLETSIEKSIDHWSREMLDLVVIDISVSHAERVKLCKKFREIGNAPMLLFLPVHHETEILDAYAAGVDEVVIKPISLAIFLAKLLPGQSGGYRYQANEPGIPSPASVDEPALACLQRRRYHSNDLGGYDNGDHVLFKNVIYRLRRKIERNPSQPVLLRRDRRYCFRE